MVDDGEGANQLEPDPSHRELDPTLSFSFLLILSFFCERNAPDILGVGVAASAEACFDDALVSVLASRVQNRVSVRILAVNRGAGIQHAFNIFVTTMACFAENLLKRNIRFIKNIRFRIEFCKQHIKTLPSQILSA